MDGRHAAVRGRGAEGAWGWTTPTSKRPADAAGSAHPSPPSRRGPGCSSRNTIRAPVGSSSSWLIRAWPRQHLSPGEPGSPCLPGLGFLAVPGVCTHWLRTGAPDTGTMVRVLSMAARCWASGSQTPGAGGACQHAQPRSPRPPCSDLEGLGWGLEPAFLVSPQGRASVCAWRTSLPRTLPCLLSAGVC